MGKARRPTRMCCMATDMEEKQTELETENASNSADNADITQSQAHDTRHRRMQETACAQIADRLIPAEYCIVWAFDPHNTAIYS